jgi:hypothetical protein
MTLRLGPRDMWAVTWLAEMRGAPMGVVAQLLGSSEYNAYRVARRWRAGGLVMNKVIRPVPGPQWVVPAPDIASSLLGFHVDRWVPGPKDARHLELTARVRLALAGNEIGEDAWVSERILRRADDQRVGFGGERPHLHDGHWIDDFGRLHAIEVELTRKGPSDARKAVAAAFAAAKTAGAASLIYYCDSTTVFARVQTAAEAVLRPRPGSSDPEFVVRDLNQLLNPPKTEPGKGGLAAAGGAA